MYERFGNLAINVINHLLTVEKLKRFNVKNLMHLNYYSHFEMSQNYLKSYVTISSVYNH